ncbi:MAG: HigA family addiction module antitoxin [Pseudomonadota bacterium]|jgi:addiction module HigA family antidote
MLPKFRVSTHPGRFLYEDFLEPSGISQSALARHIGVNPRVINEICREKRGISPKMAQLLEAALGMSGEFWMNAQAAYDLTTHRLSQFEKPEKMTNLATG